MRNLISLLVILFVGQLAKANFANVQCPSTAAIAEELVMIEAYGRQHPRSTCMTQERFPRYKMGTRSAGGGDAADTRRPLILTGAKPFQIQSVTRNSDGTHTVKFTFKAANGTSVRDELQFVEYRSGALKELFGCAAITAAAQTLTIHSNCLPK